MNDPSDPMPPLVSAFWQVLSNSPTERAWLKRHGHALIDALPLPAGDVEAGLAEILRLMREGLQGPDGWGTAVWDHDLVAEVVAAAALAPADQRRLERVESWEAVSGYVSQSLDLEEAKERALEVTERIQEVIRLAVEFELVAMD